MSSGGNQAANCTDKCSSGGSRRQNGSKCSLACISGPRPPLPLRHGAPYKRVVAAAASGNAAAKSTKMKLCTYSGSSHLALLSLTLLLPVPPTVTPHPRQKPPAVGLVQLRSVSFGVSSCLRLFSSSWPDEAAELQRRGSRRAREDGGPGGAGRSGGEALTSILGGLQSVGREKGGFGFRFGRNSRTRGRGP
ncbi:uncharacterized protein qrfp [Syngnathoides biaculeatus]|uniref:uncharacterized protein qrfp n=1 Tax=Syngnathoides biaculeatus TaxID=300417 RepID=UPI002ADE56D5|nr:uncharacterized protein qrfp [Syngnathoides biaculeatus]